MMRRSEKEITDQAEIERILSKALVLRLGMCERGEPYVVPVNFAYFEGVIYIHGAKAGRKYEILKQNPRVCFETDVDAALIEPADPENPCGFSMRFRSVIGFGLAEVVEDPEEIAPGLRILLARFSDRDYSFSPKSLARTALIRIKVDSMTGKKGGD